MGKLILNGEEYTGSSGSAPVTDVTVNGSSVVNAQGVAEVTVPDELSDLADDSTHRTVTDTEKSTWSAKVSDNPTFTEASTRANIASGESFATILGKIKKFFTDLKTVAFSGSYNDLTDKPTIPDISTKVSKSGDTMSGALTIQNIGNSIVLNRANSNTFSGWIVFKNSSGVIGQYSVDQNGRPRYIANNDSSNIKQIAFTSEIPTVPTKVSQLTNDSSFGKIISTSMNGQNTCQVGMPTSAFGSYTRYAFLLYTCAGGAIRAYLCTMQTKTNKYVIICNASLMAGSELSVSSSATQATIGGVQYNLMSFKFPSNVYDTTQVITHYPDMIIRSTQT